MNLYREVITAGDGRKPECVYCFSSDRDQEIEKVALSENSHVKIPYHPFCKKKKVIPMTPWEAHMKLRFISKKRYYGAKNNSVEKNEVVRKSDRLAKRVKFCSCLSGI